jgi:hypothetical protein
MRPCQGLEAIGANLLSLSLDGVLDNGVFYQELPRRFPNLQRFMGDTRIQHLQEPHAQLHTIAVAVTHKFARASSAVSISGIHRIVDRGLFPALKTLVIVASYQCVDESYSPTHVSVRRQCSWIRQKVEELDLVTICRQQGVVLKEAIVLQR